MNIFDNIEKMLPVSRVCLVDAIDNQIDTAADVRVNPTLPEALKSAPDPHPTLTQPGPV